MGIKVLIADDHAIVRQGLKALLEREEDIEVVGEAADGLDAIELGREIVPEVVVMDMRMPLVSGIEASRRILEVSPDTRIIMLSMTLDRACVLAALKCGVVGYLLKDCGFEELAQAIRTATANFPYLCREVTALIVRNQVAAADPYPPHTVLSQREQEVLQLVALGKSTKEIAFRFSVSTKTIEAQRKSIMKKLDLYTVAQLTKYAVRTGLSSLDDCP